MAHFFKKKNSSPTFLLESFKTLDAFYLEAKNPFDECSKSFATLLTSAKRTYLPRHKYILSLAKPNRTCQSLS